MRRVDGLLLECLSCRKMLPRGRFHLTGRAAPTGRSIPAAPSASPAASALRGGTDALRGGTDGGSRKRAWCKDCMRASRAAVAARRRSRVVGTYTGEDVRRLMVAQSSRCRACGVSLLIMGYHVDHIVAIAKGGLNVAANLQLLCPRCNLSKGAR
jgi:hypothetical protein